MASKKKQKKSPPGKREDGISLEKNPARSVEARAAAGQAEPEPMAVVKGGSRKVSLATCIGGMLLSLALGLYLGTLLPGILGQKEEDAAPPPVAEPVAEEPALEPELKQAVADLEKRAAANPQSAPDWINLGNVYFDARMPHAAITAYEHALKLAPQNADVLTDLGIMYRETGEYEKAVTAFRKACEVDPGHQNAMFNEGVVLATDLHRPEEARIAWRRLLQINPGAVAPNGESLGEMISKLR